LKLEIYNTIFTRSIRSSTDIRSFTGIGNPMGIERSIDIGNVFGNKEVDHLFYGDFKEVDHLL